MARKRNTKAAVELAQVEGTATTEAIVETALEALSAAEVDDYADYQPTDAELDALAEALETAGDHVEPMVPGISTERPSLDAIIDASMETAATAGIVDYGSHIPSTWVPEDLANDVLGPVASGQVSDDAASEFARITASHDDDVVEQMVWAIKAQVDDRDAFEHEKNPNNNSIKSTLKKIRSQLVTKRAARVMLTCNVDPAFMNRVRNSGSRYNVYAVGKFADIVFGLTGGIVSNAINLACLRSLFACAKADVTFTSDVARACASKNWPTDPAIRKHLTRHTVARETANTQGSSTMQALVTLGVVNASGSIRNPIYTVADTPIAKELEGLFGA